MIEQVLGNLMLREGMPKESMLIDMLKDCEQDLKDMIHVDTLNEEHASILKELVMIKINHDGAEGIGSENHSGVSTSYLDDLPRSLKRRIFAKRKLLR